MPLRALAKVAMASETCLLDGFAGVAEGIVSFTPGFARRGGL